MNEIEQAINQLIDLRIDRASFFGGEGTEIYQADVAALDVALAALREKLERERGRKVINARTDKAVNVAAREAGMSYGKYVMMLDGAQR